ncbi:MAG: InlB B-repeat-containing protein, partial [Clostridia bacterium]|nr:InlB B-repeat-containing protein [Clostridia bacterium]
DKMLVGRQDDEQVTLTILPGNGYRYEPDSLRLMDVDRDNGAQMDITSYMDTITENSVYSIYIGSGDLYVYADFERVPEQPKHCVVVDGETENGTISADYDLAEAGWTVKVTATPDAFRGYAVRSVTVTDAAGTAYSVTDLGYNEYTFTMPSTDVFVTAEFGIPVYAITTDCPSAAATGCELETDEEAEAGDDVAVWLTVFDEFLLESLTVTGDRTGANYPISLDYHRDGSALYRYKFTMPGESVTVSAVFGNVKYALTVNEAVEGAVTFTVDGEAATEAAYGERVDVTYVYENKAGTYEDLVDSVTYAFTMNGATARRPLDDLTITDGTCTGTFTMPASPVEIGASYVSPYTVSLAAVQNGSIEASVNGVPHVETFRVYPGETVRLYAASSLSDKVSAEWRVAYTDETGEHSAAVTRISDSAASFTMPAASVTVSAELTPLGVPYMERSWNSADKSVTEQLRYYTGEYTNVSSITNDAMTGGWYVLDGNVTFEDRITVSGSVRLILTDGMTLTAEKGIRVPEGAKLSIYGQSDDSGTLIVTGSSGSAGIGGDEGGAHGSINIYGGTIDATGGSRGAGIGTGEDAEGACGAVCIFGGDITALGGEYGAGIGGGDESTGAQIEIYGGDIHAKGGDEGAGIGGGCECGPSRVTIRGGKIDAKGGKYGAGIGEGYDASSATSSGTIEIRGCESIYATGGYLAAGIGGGFYNNTKINVYISGGEDIYAYGNSENDCGSAGIGAGSFSNITGVQSGGGDFDGVISISGGTVHAVGSGTYASFSETNAGAAGLGAGYGGNMTGSITVSGGAVRAVGTNGGAAIGAGAETWGPSYGGECEGSVTITGGTIELRLVNNSGENKALLIGHGCNGDTNGDLTFGPTMRVTGSDLRPVAAGDRVSTCRSSAMLALIEECNHQNATYQRNNEEMHIRNCANCLFSEEEEHFFYDGSCDCGAEGCGVFFFDGEDLLDARMSYGQGGTVEPPEDPEKADLIFGGWYPYFDNDFAEPYDFDTPICEDVYLKARWLAKIELSVYDRTTRTFGVGGTIAFDGDEDFGTYRALTADQGFFFGANARKDEGYDFVGWAFRDTIGTIYIPTAGFSTRLTKNTHLCAVFEEHVHTLRFVSGHEPECEYYGEIDHYKCTKCGKYFSDEDGRNELTEEDIMIPALQHDWNAPVYEWSENYSELTALRVCKNDEDHVDYEIVEVSSEVTKEPTCTEKGETTYTSASFENEAFEAQSITVADISARGHSYGEWTTVQPATCTEAGLEQRVCANDESHKETRPVNATGHTYGTPVWNWTDDYKAAVTLTCVSGDDTQTPDVTVTNRVTAEPTATAEGKRVYTATAEFNGQTYTDTKEEILPATGTPDEPDPHTDPDQPSGEKRCKWCDQVHTGFWGSIVGFFHAILYFFAHLFGRG